MPKRTDIKSILIIGAGPIVIGQACEFDYSGTQACKALKEEGYRVILVNSNPATIMTDPELADATYIEPITPELVAKIIEKEKPDALLPTMGGQTALNCALALNKNGVLEKHNVKLIGASVDAIDKAESRSRFNIAMAKIGLEVPRNAVVHTLEEAREAVKKTGLPAIIRPSFTLGGSGGGVARTMEEFERIVESGLDASPTTQVLIDESLIGWKEYEMEVVRDKNDNCIIVCSIENVDPMGVHTGDSITIAPALTLTDKEYQIMRDASLAVLREIGVETGGSNVQFAINPKDGRMVVIEMNPRVSRSSALASKATGFPIAKVAAKLAIGYTLDEIMNDCTKATPASFEPSIDYVVTKIPRFTFEKFPGADPVLSSAMKSVGEVMAIGGTFKESLQKALRSMETGKTGLDDIKTTLPLKDALAKQTPDRLLQIAQAFREGMSLKEIQDITAFDPWFLEQIGEIVAEEKEIKKADINTMTADELRHIKQSGFSDRRIAKLTGKTEKEIRTLRHDLGVRPVYKRVDTCAAEFKSATPYMYSTYWGEECEADVSTKTKTVILGSGPNRIGQGIEFDYACVHAAYALKEAGYETIMVNCNPETVSTDYDTSDRLYFEPLTEEDVIEIIRVEEKKGKVKGVNVQFGGQTPLKLARALESEKINLLGTSHDAIDLAEDRERFQQLLHKLGLKQPKNFICHTEDEVKRHAKDIGFPVVVRPSYVLGGRAMAIVHDAEQLTNYLDDVREFFENGPLLLDSFLYHATEVDVDAIADGTDVYVTGVMEHIEEAGIHSGDSACALPPYSLPKEVIEEIKEQTVKLAKALKVVGLMNVQYAVKDGDIYILEVNPRSSRTVPFVAKATGLAVAKIAARVMAGEKLSGFKAIKQTEKRMADVHHVAVKEAVFPFARFDGVDVILGPEMKSTGEVMGIDRNFASAFAKSQIASGSTLPLSGTVFISVKDDDKEAILFVANTLKETGFNIIATKGTADYLQSHGIEVETINKVYEGGDHIVGRMKEGKVQLVINTTEGIKSIQDSFSIRRTALIQKIPYTTTATGAVAMVKAIRQVKSDKSIEVHPLQSYFK
ncbi:MAG: carbamoyl-phosphate synthase large subunit [Proteobacteria bacterium]|nr:carbamoyl-phosphate synthase large subunit [Pseudomonadota bacterium]